MNIAKNDDFSGCNASKTGPISPKIDENTLKKLLKVAQWVSTAEKSKIPKLVCREFGSYYEFPNLHGFFNVKFLKNRKSKFGPRDWQIYENSSSKIWPP